MTMTYEIETSTSLHVHGIPVDLRNRLLDYAFAEQRGGELQIYSEDMQTAIVNLWEEDELSSAEEHALAFIQRKMALVGDFGYDIYIYVEV